MDKSPQLMDFSRMRDIFDNHVELVSRSVYLDSELAIIHGSTEVIRLMASQKPPFTINDHRIGMVLRGELLINLNLVEKRLGAGTLVFIGPGSIINPMEFTPDLEIYGFGLSARFTMPFAPGAMPAAFNGQVRDFQLLAGEADLVTARNIVDAIWHIVHQPDYNRQTVGALVAAQMHHYDRLFRQHEAQLEATRSREQTIFDRFIYLVNRHSQTEHHLQFYAAKMCLTERYLGTVVRQTSGTTAKAWIDRAIVMRVKAELRHTDKSAAQIADEMNFPNPSFFSKYFKRLTGLTPQDYKRQPV